MDKVYELSLEEIKNSTIDARLAALRWDVVPWSLVLDLDTPVTENANALMKRAWIILTNISELSFPLSNARIPNGCWLTSQIGFTTLSNNFINYEVSCLLPSFNQDDELQNNPVKNISVIAQGIIGLSSTQTGRSTDKILDRKIRTDLADDVDFLSFYKSIESRIKESRFQSR